MCFLGTTLPGAGLFRVRDKIYGRSPLRACFLLNCDLRFVVGASAWEADGSADTPGLNVCCFEDGGKGAPARVSDEARLAEISAEPDPIDPAASD